MTPKLDALDHLVLTIGRIDRTVEFYVRVLGMHAEAFNAADGSERIALKFGSQKINLHEAGHEFEPRAQTPQPGSRDFCFVSRDPLESWQRHLHKLGVTVEAGPVVRTGATGQITSIYIRDPDGNLVEISNTNDD